MTGDALLMAGVLLLGASVQRLAGIGLALVAGPALALVLGPAEGVRLSNVAAGAISAFGLATVWRQVRPGAMVPLLAAAICTVPIGAVTAARLPAPVLLTGMGAMVCGAVGLVMAGARAESLRGRGGAVTAGAVSGFMNSSAGIGGPAVSLYAVNAGWTVREFVPNALFYGVVINIVSVTAKGPPDLEPGAWALCAAAVAAGALIGRALGDRVPEAPARRLVLILGLAGGAATLTKGLVGL